MVDFTELTAHEKALYTLKCFKKRKLLDAKGKKEAALYSYENNCKIKKRLKGEKKSSLKG